jgi:hypothetical protein
VSPGFGRRRRSLQANSAPSFRHQCRTLSWVTITARGEDQLNIPQAQAEHVIQPYGMADHLGRKSVPKVGAGRGRRRFHAVSLARPKPLHQGQLTCQYPLSASNKSPRVAEEHRLHADCTLGVQSDRSRGRPNVGRADGTVALSSEWRALFDARQRKKGSFGNRFGLEELQRASDNQDRHCRVNYYGLAMVYRT